MRITVLVAAEFTPSPGQSARWLAALPAARQAALARFPDPRARDRSLLASRLLRHGLDLLGFDPASLGTLHHPPFGRPTLPLPLDFSLSHCEGMLLCALSPDGPVGADVEGDGTAVADDFPLYLDPGERARAGRDPRRFLALWTRKEAVAKAAGGDGLGAVRRVRTAARGHTALLDGRQWRTAPVGVGAAHVAHVAWPAQRPARLRVHAVAVRDLA